MRFRKLSLDRFGHFTDQSFDFGAVTENPDFHIIYGPNEAGKTTTMEGALRLLYGFPNNEGYQFKHLRKNLQVSGMVEIDGQTRHFTRLPKKSGTLVDEHGSVLPEAALSSHLAGLSKDDYQKLLCLDDATLESGGEEITKASGDIGRLLFSAAAGVSDLSTVLQGVREDADAIWRKGRSKTRVAELKRALTEVERDIRDKDVSANAWKGLKRDVASAVEDERTARHARDTLHKRSAQVSAMGRAFPILAEIDALKSELQPFAAYPERLDFNPETLLAHMTNDAQARADLDRLTKEIADMSARLDGLEVVKNLEDLIAGLNALEDLSARDRTASQDLTRRSQEVKTLDAELEKVARDLGVVDGDKVDSLILSHSQITQLNDAHDAVAQACNDARGQARELTTLQTRRDQAQAALDHETAQTPRPTGIAEVLGRYDVDHLAPAYASALQALSAAKNTAQTSLDALAIGALHFKRLPLCSISEIKAREWASEAAEISQTLRSEEAAYQKHTDDVAAYAVQIEQIMKKGGVVADGDAQAMKQRRDLAWDAHASALDADTAQAFVAQMKAFDAAQDHRLLQAQDLGQLRQLIHSKAEAQTRAQQAEARMTVARAKQKDIEDRVTTAVADIGLPQMSADEWSDWVARHAVAAQDARKLVHLEDTHSAALDRAAAFVRDVSEHLSFEDPTFESAVSAARALAKSEMQTQSALSKAQEGLAVVMQDLADRETLYETALMVQEKAMTAWDTALVAHFGQPSIGPALMASLDPLRALRQIADKRDDVAARVTRMKADQTQFSIAVKDLAEKYEVADADTAAARFTALRAFVVSSQTTQAQAETLKGRIEGAEQDHRAAQRCLEDIAHHISVLSETFPEDAPTHTLSDLRQTALTAQSVIEKRGTRAKLERDLMAELECADMDAVRRLLSDSSPATTQAEAATLEADLVTAEASVTKATEIRVGAEHGLAQVTGNADIAVLNERKATLELELEDAAVTFLELSLGHRLADEAIRRYRDTHRSGMMAATEKCFAMLTQGAYTRLIAQPEKDREILLAVDANGVTKQAAEMSKGTRFQLYLALRAAAHEQLVKEGNCLPFFCDDIFETFDEGRTSAACLVMEDIGRRGQAIYLTHHQHVVDIALKVCKVPPTIHRI
ncbi:hypothetical protein ASD8599_01128 [Ascidiaceihabitans donghaensis]|uniref:YhaN AAA domain-containing protein n=1 Tax=Ascidiaceihabitans donghaensis TaxID=1510460 RepID=A0A2R8BBD7_9RHOB|nr:YhaN family protein [Ascidiaceihabitans donghaensis]SPH20393.1 hypothetical protein ASD8599_01128 [Ascidiaceihabitans donghaensis]